MIRRYFSSSVFRYLQERARHERASRIVLDRSAPAGDVYVGTRDRPIEGPQVDVRHYNLNFGRRWVRPVFPEVDYDA